jgi:hypothetical protein
LDKEPLQEYNWYATAGSGATINQTLTNPSNATAGTVEYIVTPTSTTGTCTGAAFTKQ